MRFVCKLSPSKFAPPFFEHSLLVGLFSLGIASTEQYAPAVAGDTAKLAEIMKAGIIHNSEALSNIDAILQLPEIKRSDTYWESIRNGYFVLGTLKLGYDTMDAIRILCEYFLGRKDFIGHDDIMNKSEWPSIMANIILVADAYLQKEKGLFGIPQSPRQAIDALNVSTVEKNYNKIAIAALTIGLKFEDIFDFYREMDKLIKECPSNAAWPYPLTGFKSPTIFVCKGNCVECNYYEKMMQAVTLLKPLGDLPEGNYSRCLLLTPKLISFYKSHYDEIKEETAEKAKAPKKE